MCVEYGTQGTKIVEKIITNYCIKQIGNSFNRKGPALKHWMTVPAFLLEIS